MKAEGDSSCIDSTWECREPVVFVAVAALAADWQNSTVASDKGLSVESAERDLEFCAL